MRSVAKQLTNLEKVGRALDIKKNLLIEKALRGNSPNDIIKAQQQLVSIQEREKSKKKSFIIDPMDFNSSFGYKDRAFSLSYTTLRRMAKTPIINAIIKTRKNQVADFCEPQSDKYSTGFIIRRKKRIGETENKTNKKDLKRAEEIQNIILNCGVNESWENDDFDTFIRKLVDDSLTFDQMTFEVVRDRKGGIFEFFATAADTFRVADSFDDDNYSGEPKTRIKGYLPSYVQVLMGRVESEYYPWELCFGVRNPTTSLLNSGYGTSELEDLVTTVTSMLWGEEYNRKFFSQGSAPKGLLRVKGKVNEGQLQAFRQEWLSMISGVSQSWKTPIVDADIDWIDLQKSNRDMEYQKWMEFLIKLSCAIYSIDPKEIGFDLSGGEGQPLFKTDSGNAVKASKDKGLYPLLKFIQRKITKYIVNQIDPEFEFVFAGMNGLTIQEELDMDIKEVQNFSTLNEVRTKRGLKKLPDEEGNIILNAIYSQNKMALKQEEQAAQAGQPGEEGEEEKDFNPFDQSEEEEGGEDKEESPIKKAFEEHLISRNSKKKKKNGTITK